MGKITRVWARQILDSRGWPTVEAEVEIEGGFEGRASVPSGASTGKYEACELRDGNSKAYLGKSVIGAVKNVKGEIQTLLKGKDLGQQELDNLLREADGTDNKSRLGANAILAVSLAFSRAKANESNTPLFEYFKSLSKTAPDSWVMPVPMMNVLNGGRHANGASDFQEYMIIPAIAVSFSDALEKSDCVFHKLKSLLAKKGLPTTVGDEGGFAPALGSNTAPIDLIAEATTEAGLKFGQDIKLALDTAASEFFKDGAYNLSQEGKVMTRDELIGYYEELVKKYPLVSLEDGLEQDDWEGFGQLTAKIGEKVQIVGDDLFVTNTKRLEEGIQKQAANAILIKLNQIGSVTETVQAVDLARENGLKAIISHRSGETEDAIIADLVVGLGTGQIKTGSLSRSERLAKYNQLLRIEEMLGEKARYIGWES